MPIKKNTIFPTRHTTSVLLTNPYHFSANGHKDVLLTPINQHSYKNIVLEQTVCQNSEFLTGYVTNLNNSELVINQSVPLFHMVPFSDGNIVDIPADNDLVSKNNPPEPQKYNNSLC